MKNTNFQECILHEVDFSDANLTQSDFSDSDLLNATFDNTTLDGASVLTAYHFDINPLKNRTKKMKISLTGLPGLLTHFDLDIRK
jgi:uncharacterized protein YjbI with pentapeptide repeats